MINNSQIFEVPNINAKDANTKKIIFKISDLKLNENKVLSKNEYVCICSGGTTSSCAKSNLITLDLRKNHNNISFNNQNGIISIGGGVLMKDLLDELDKHGRFFPTGLSNMPGVGYILTGGISPLSRRYGLAIDNIEFFKGYLGNGKYFSISKKEIKAEDIEIWQGLKGAAPFFSIITEIGLNTFKSFPILICEGFVLEKELEELIELAETFPPNLSLQWMFTEKIYIYIVGELKTSEDKTFITNLLSSISKFKDLKIQTFSNFNQLKFFPKELRLFELNQANHSEVLSLLGNNTGKNTAKLIQTLTEINKGKPNNSCYVACQQLGYGTEREDGLGSFFVYRESIWKPWIYTSWHKNDLKEREKAINWLVGSWQKLKEFYPNIHLAQLHNHLDFHNEEIELAYGRKFNKLKRLKNIYDPEGNLPPL